MYVTFHTSIHFMSTHTSTVDASRLFGGYNMINSPPHTSMSPTRTGHYSTEIKDGNTENKIREISLIFTADNDEIIHCCDPGRGADRKKSPRLHHNTH